MRYFFLLSSIVLFAPFAHSTSKGGSIELDELSFNKITKKFKASLIKFDVAFPFGDKHEAFLSLAKDAKDEDDLLVAEVGVKDYGEKDNEALANQYGANKDNFPVVKLFIKGKSEPLTFDSKDFTSDELRRFVRENTNVYLSLPGCVKELDKLAADFIKADKDGRKKVLKKTEELTNNKLSDKDKVSGHIYKTIMQKILEKGDDFVESEYTRVKKIFNSKVSEEKKKEIGIRMNILQSFKSFDKKVKTEKQEL